MSGSVSGSIQDTVGATAQHVAGGIHNAVQQAGQTACRAQDGVGEVRAVIRAQPITAALAVFALGYLFGRVGSLIPSRGTRRA